MAKPRSVTKPASKTKTRKFLFQIPVKITHEGRVSMGAIAQELTQFLKDDFKAIAGNINIENITDASVGTGKFTDLDKVTA